MVGLNTCVRAEGLGIEGLGGLRVHGTKRFGGHVSTFPLGHAARDEISLYSHYQHREPQEPFYGLEPVMSRISQAKGN